MKRCTKCNLDKQLSEFSKRKKKNGAEYHITICKMCVIIYRRNYYIDHKEKIDTKNKKYYLDRKEEVLVSRRKWKDKNKERVREKNKEYRLNNKDSISEKIKRIKANNKEKYNEISRIYLKKRRAEDLFYKLRKNVSKSVYHHLRNRKDNKSILKYLTYSIEDLRLHLESLFESWMGWDNYGPYKKNIWKDDDQKTWTWQIDHIIPHSDLPYDSMEHPNFKKCWELGNLRPLSAKQNLLDGTRRIRHKSA